MLHYLPVSFNDLAECFDPLHLYVESFRQKKGGASPTLYNGILYYFAAIFGF